MEPNKYAEIQRICTMRWREENIDRYREYQKLYQRAYQKARRERIKAEKLAAKQKTA